MTRGDTDAGPRSVRTSLPRASVRLISLVPDDTSDIREAPAAPFTSIENRESRANLLQTVVGILFGLAVVFALVMLISMIRRQTPKSTVEIAHLGPRPILGAVAKELDEVQRASRGGWTPELVGRALAALRVAGAYATIVPSASGRQSRARRRQEGVIVVRQFGRGEVYVSGAATTETAAFANTTAGQSDAMKTLTVARLRTAREVRLDGRRGGADRDPGDEGPAVGAFVADGMVEVVLRVGGGSQEEGLVLGS